MSSVVLLLVCLAVIMPATVTAAIASADRCVPVTLRLRSITADRDITDALLARSEPTSPLFRQHLDMEAVKKMFSAPRDVIDAITAMFPGAATSVTGDSMFVVKCDWTVPREAITYAHPTSEWRALIEPSLIVGDTLARHVRLAVAHLHRDVVRPDRVAARLGGQFPGVNQNPNTIRARYNIPNTTLPSAAGANITAQAVAEFEGEQFVYSNMVAFARRYGDSDLVNVSVLGPNSGGYFGEGNLDLEYIMSLAQGSPTWWVELSEFDMTAWVEQFITIAPLPSVASISWGSGSSGFQFSDLESDTLHFQKLGLLGVSVLAASGDVGTGSTGFFSCGTFDSNWPASSPFVTAVGATYTNTTIGGPETSWSGSGGGFSAFFDRPAWQNAAVEGYLNNTKVAFPSRAFWNSTGRGVPDVAAVGTNFEVFSSGWGVETGTSAATPTFASIITRINAERLSKGGKTLGFLNPRLYQLGRVGYDVTSGNNRNPSCPAGFEATVGWDAISGLGTPDFEFLNLHL